MSDVGMAIGVAEAIMPGLRRLLAPNPSPMTGPGTNTYILGSHDVAVVDPGPDDAGHFRAIMAATQGRVSHILVTHAHRDHSALAPKLAAETGAPVCAFGPPEAGRSPIMRALAARDTGGGEGVDKGFKPDVRLAAGDHLNGPDWQVKVLHIPGHFAGHLAFDTGMALLTGDHVLGFASTLISPPDGDLGAFMRTSKSLLSLTDRPFLPGHGGAIDAPERRLRWLIDHRQQRAAAIRRELTHGPATAQDLVLRIYADIPASMHAAAERSLLAHLIDLMQRNEAVALPDLSTNATFALR